MFLSKWDKPYQGWHPQDDDVIGTKVEARAPATVPIIDSAPTPYIGDTSDGVVPVEGVEDTQDAVWKGIMPDNYTGPNWSNGKVQESVKFGDAVPLNYGDSQSRLHDSAYAQFKDKWHREAADMIYRDRLKGQRGFYRAVAQAPLYGNYAKNQAKSLGTSVYNGFKYFGPVGAIGGAIVHELQYIKDMQHRLGGLAKERKAVLDFYAQDPLAKTHQLPENPGQFSRPKTRRNQILPSLDEKRPAYRSDRSNRLMTDYVNSHPHQEQNTSVYYPNFADLYRPLGRKKKSKNKKN